MAIGKGDTDRYRCASSAPPLPCPRFVVGVTGHRSSHPSFPADASELDRVIAALFERIDRQVARCRMPEQGLEPERTRLVTLLADGTDHHAALAALARGWELVSPLPFGQRLNAAINAKPPSPADARAILSAERPADPATAARVEAIDGLTGQARLFELADEDERIGRSLLAALDRPDDPDVLSRFIVETSRRAALAGRILIEQADIVIAVWDGGSTAQIGGTGHTARLALEAGSPVLWIDPSRPAEWEILLTPEALASAGEGRHGGSRENDALEQIVEQAIGLAQPHVPGRYSGTRALAPGAWTTRSSFASHAFRRVEALFGDTGWRRRLRSLRQTYEDPGEIEQGSGKPILDLIAALPEGDPQLRSRIGNAVLRRFAWSDGISAHLSDRYRSGMVVNFLLGAAAIIVGTLYLPLVEPDQKWIFAGIELLLLLAIIINTVAGQRARLHDRWFQTRRAAEYLRHSPFLLALGVMRPAGAWPSGVKSWWPEWYARHALREVGLPVARVEKTYLRSALLALRDQHIAPQSAYHRAKAARLHRVDHGIDRLAEALFVLAVTFVTIYLALFAGSQMGWIDDETVGKSSKWFTVAAVAFPTLGGALAAIRYFGDFDRFAEISQIAHARLDAVAARIDLLLGAPAERFSYRQVADLAHATDEIVVGEIQNWQAVFSGKKTTIPA